MAMCACMWVCVCNGTKLPEGRYYCMITWYHVIYLVWCEADGSLLDDVLLLLVVAVDDDVVTVCCEWDGTRMEFNDGLIANSGMGTEY